MCTSISDVKRRTELCFAGLNPDQRLASTEKGATWCCRCCCCSLRDGQPLMFLFTLTCATSNKQRITLQNRPQIRNHHTHNRINITASICIFNNQRTPSFVPENLNAHHALRLRTSYQGFSMCSTFTLDPIRVDLLSLKASDHVIALDTSQESDTTATSLEGRPSNLRTTSGHFQTTSPCCPSLRTSVYPTDDNPSTNDSR